METVHARTVLVRCWCGEGEREGEREGEGEGESGGEGEVRWVSHVSLYAGGGRGFLEFAFASGTSVMGKGEGADESERG